jgi:hypothetical protein
MTVSSPTHIGVKNDLTCCITYVFIFYEDVCVQGDLEISMNLGRLIPFNFSAA